MTKEQLQYEIKHFTGKDIPLEELTEKQLQETATFTEQRLQSATKLSVDELLSYLRYEKHIYYNQKFNM